MNIQIFKDYASLSAFAAKEIIHMLKQKPDATLCMASGDSPKLTCELFVKKARDEKVNLSEFFFIGLDEWVGLSGDTEGGCHHDFNKRIFNPLRISPAQYHLFNGLSDDLENECVVMDKIIREKGGIDLMIVGIGMNGHIGFNEPGVDFKLLSHVTELDETTVTVGQKYFQEQVVLQKGITLGLAHLMNAKKVLLLAQGAKKAAVIQKAVEGEISNFFPASIMQQHLHGYVLVDEEAASLLNKAH